MKRSSTVMLIPWKIYKYILKDEKGDKDYGRVNARVKENP